MKLENNVRKLINDFRKTSAKPPFAIICNKEDREKLFKEAGYYDTEKRGGFKTFIYHGVPIYACDDFKELPPLPPETMYALSKEAFKDLAKGGSENA